MFQRVVFPPLIFLGFVVVGFMANCSGGKVEVSSPDPAKVNSVVSVEGAELHGYECPGYIVNTNTEDIRVKCTYISRGLYGPDSEVTLWILRVHPGQKINITKVSKDSRYYIRELNGAEISFITPEKNGKEAGQ